MSTKTISRKTFHFIIVLCFSIIPDKLIAQSDFSKIKISSPNAASLGKFVDIPVNYHTGIPKINIPLYTIKEGELDLPISVSYHAGGIKVAEGASWVGAGWALNAGGVITRSVRGIPDEAANTVAGRNGHFNNYGFSSYLVDDAVYSNGNIPNIIKNGDLLDRSSDGEPDLFFFNFNGHSGKFYFNDDRKPILVSADEDLKIDYYYRLPASQTLNFLQNNIQGFCITTNDGTKYFFGRTEVEEPVEGVYPVEISIPFTLSNGLSSDRVASSWFLSKIESADKKSSIQLLYEAESYSNYYWSFFPVPILSFGTDEASQGYQLSKLYMYGVRLSKINFSNGSVVFSVSDVPRLDLSNGLRTFMGYEEKANTEAKALKEISISNNNSVFKKISFYTGYFEDKVSSSPTRFVETDSKSLRLDSILETGSDGGLLKPYKFSYNGNFLPRKLSFSLDHWGFYNGAVNSGVIPGYSIDTYNVYPGANRESSWPEMQSGILNRVTYPTGGNIDFEFEPNVARADAIKYNLVYDKQFWVGFDGSPSKEWKDVSFTGGDKYEVKFVNTECGFQNPGGSCSASYSIVRADGTIAGSGSAKPGEIEGHPLSIQPGVYTIRMYRDGSRSGNGATVTFSKYSPIAVKDPIVGGLRIKKITKDAMNSSSKPIVENYSYTENGRSTGILYERPYYVYGLRSDLAAKIGVNTSSMIYDPAQIPTDFFVPALYGCLPVRQAAGFKYENTVKSGGSILPMFNVQGNHIGYRSVRVEQNLGGYSIYRFYGRSLYENEIDDVAYRNLNSTCDPRSPSFPAVPLQFEFQRGELMSEDHFDTGGALVKTVINTLAYDSTKVYTPAVMSENLQGFRSQAEYQLRGYWKKYIVRQETLMDKQNLKGLTTVDTTFFDSPFHRSPSRKTVILSNGNKQITNFKYALDFRVPGADAISDGWDTYLSGCETCKIDYVAKISDPSASFSQKAIYYHMYRACVARVRKKYINYQRTNFTDPGNSFDAAHLNAKNTANNEFKPILEMHDQFVNALVETNNWLNGKLSEATYNGFSFEQNSSNTYLSEIKRVGLTTPLSTLFSASTNTNTSIAKDSRYYTQFLYKKINGNIVEQSKDKGIKEVFLWGYKGKYPVARILSSDYASASSLVAHSVLDNSATTAVQMRTELNKLRLGLPDAQVSTYTYDPLVGITSQTDEKGQTIYYEFDEFQRLKNVKDQNGNIIKNNIYNYKN